MGTALVVSLAAISVVCRVAHACQLRYLLQQRFFDAAFKGHIDRTAPLASPTKTQDCKLIVGHFDQGHLTTMGRDAAANQRDAPAVDDQPRGAAAFAAKLLRRRDT